MAFKPGSVLRAFHRQKRRSVLLKPLLDFGIPKDKLALPILGKRDKLQRASWLKVRRILPIVGKASAECSG